MPTSGPTSLRCLQACISVDAVYVRQPAKNHDLFGLMRLQGKAGRRTTTNMQRQAHRLTSLEREPRHKATQPSALATLMRLSAVTHAPSRRTPAMLSTTAIEQWLISKCALPSDLPLWWGNMNTGCGNCSSVPRNNKFSVPQNNSLGAVFV